MPHDHDFLMDPIGGPPTPGGPLELPVPVIRAGIHTVEGCPILTRLKTFVVQQGTEPWLEHVVRDEHGNPIALTHDELSIQARSKERVAPIGTRNPLKIWDGAIQTAESGVVRVRVDVSTFPKAGIYDLNIAVVYQETSIVRVDQVLVWVEPTLMLRTAVQDSRFGPPTVADFRLTLQDSARQENTLLDGLEFGDEQFAHALCKPIEYWNEQPPPIRPMRDTRNFPFREAWIRASTGYLLEYSAASYRRNYLAAQAGGVSVDDKQKENAYAATARALLDEWRAFVAGKKTSLNAAAMVGWID